jgi:hypothetical protein
MQGNESLPSRVLDIEPQVNTSIVLVESRDIQCRANCPIYATLSHCWGRAPVIQTTQQTLAKRKRCIEWESLPQTFQDAISIARALSIRYIWIDSLCVIQDDENDWQRQSACMASIYSNSYLNIAATGSSDSRGGCLAPRSIRHGGRTLKLVSFPVIPNAEDSWPAIRVRHSFQPVHHPYSNQSNRNTFSSDPLDKSVVPLLSRAWVFQERRLAPRTVHFHPSEMVMECRSSLYCECTGLNNIDSLSCARSLDLKSFQDRQVLDYWYDIVEEFSRLRLSRESDRLIALTGVATVFQDRIKSGYLAGLWQADIARGLLWDVTRYQNLRVWHITRQHKSVAPTWYVWSG